LLSSAVKIVALSGSSRGGASSFLEKALAAGADLRLDKPFGGAISSPRWPASRAVRRRDAGALRRPAEWADRLRSTP
jgi:hypothetical protein